VSGEVAVELDRQAERDLCRLHPNDRRLVLRATSETLTCRPLPANADDKVLKGRAPWRRLRVGELRILWREVEDHPRCIVRILHRRDLERSVRTLPG
jgi:mRNA-degrading endonuclease RelE of RelBE toxin-antitoxin system